MYNLSEKIKGKQIQLSLLGLAICCIFILFFFLNKIYPLWIDDWDYTFIYGLENTKVNSFADILQSQYNHYFMWGGRSIVHIICQSLLMMDFTSMCIVNAIAYTLFVYIFYLIANKENKVNPVLFILLNTFIWFSQPAFFAAVVWKTGSANYLWGTLIIISFIYPYYSYYRTRKTKDHFIYIFIFFIGGIITGWTNENMSIALICYIFSTLFLLKREKTKIPAWAISGFIGLCMGCLIMLAAPGNYVRMDVFAEIHAAQNLTRLDVFISILNDMGGYFIRYILPLLIIQTILALVYNKYPRNPSNKRRIMISSTLFSICGFIALISMSVSPTFPDRALFGILILFLIPLGIIIANIDFSTKYLKIISIIGAIAFITVFSYRYYRAYRALKPIKKEWKERELIVNKSKAQGIDTIIFTNRIKYSRKYTIFDLSDDSESWENVSYARYYGIRSVKVEKDDN